MGRKRKPPKGPPKTYKEALTARLHEFVGELTNADIARKIGVSEITVAKWFQGYNTPDLDYWPALAMALGLSDASHLAPPGFTPPKTRRKS